MLSTETSEIYLLVLSCIYDLLSFPQSTSTECRLLQYRITTNWPKLLAEQCGILAGIILIALLFKWAASWADLLELTASRGWPILFSTLAFSVGNQTFYGHSNAYLVKEELYWGISSGSSSRSDACYAPCAETMLADFATNRNTSVEHGNMLHRVFLLGFILVCHGKYFHRRRTFEVNMDNICTIEIKFIGWYGVVEDLSLWYDNHNMISNFGRFH